LIPQSVSPTFSPYLRCGAQVCDVLLAHGLPRRQAAKRAVALLDEAGLPTTRHAFDAWPHELSGGELQRVAIARALAMAPALLVADECAASLDLLTANALRRTLLALRESHQLSIVWITHDLSELPGFADRVLTLQDGHCVDSFPLNPFRDGLLHPGTARLLAAIPRQVLSSAGEEASQ
jgi:ABC-type dipeptide/oligopeptide/nickel transport system ATPase component